MKPIDYASLLLDAKHGTDKDTSENRQEDISVMSQEPATEPLTETPDISVKIPEQVSRLNAPVPNSEKPEEPEFESGPIPGNHDADVDAFLNAEPGQEIEVPVVPEAVSVLPVSMPENYDDTPDDDYDLDDNDEEIDKDRPETVPGRSAFGKPSGMMNKQEGQVKASRVKGVPKSLIHVAKGMFPGANQDDAISAYIYLKEGRPARLNVPDTIRDLANQYADIHPQDTLLDLKKDMMNFMKTEFQKVSNHEMQILRGVNDVKLVSAFTAYDRMGFADTHPHNIRDISFTQGQMKEFIAKLEDTSRNYMDLRNKAEGRRP